MIVAIHQPQYLPWIGYFAKMQRADAFCFLDNVQYKKNEWQNRNRIKTAQGWQWLTVPVRYRYPGKINEIAVDNTADWSRKHWQALLSNYGKAPFFNDHIEFFSKAYRQKWDSLVDINMYLIGYIREVLGLAVKPAVSASRLKLSDDPTGRLLDICEALGGDTYLSGPDGGKYMDLDRFAQRGVAVITQNFHHPVYPQRFGDFISRLSIVDLLFNCGPQSLQKIIEADSEDLPKTR